MKLIHLLVSGIAVYATFDTRAQGHLNVGFESATVSATPANGFGSDVSVSDAFPSWRAYLAGGEVFTAMHNNFSLGSPAVAIVGPNWGTSQGIIEGGYTALLTAGTGSAALAQTAIVPANAESVLFKARPGNGTLAVSINGSTVPIIPMATSSGVIEYGANIPGFKGTLAELRFTAVPIDPGVPILNLWYLDSISFSSQVVPEPSTIVLFSLGACFVLRWGRQRHNRNFIFRTNVFRRHD